MHWLRHRLGAAMSTAAAAYASEAANASDELGSKYDSGIARRLLGQAAALAGEPFVADFDSCHYAI